MQTTNEPQIATKIEIREVPEQPCLLISAKKKMEELPAFLQESYGKLYGYAQGKGRACFARYPSWTKDEFTIEAGIVTAEPMAPQGEIECGTYGGHRALFVVHKGPYDKVGAAYGAIQGHMEEKAMKSAGAPYEVYLNDPRDVPESELQTEVYWPIE